MFETLICYFTYTLIATVRKRSLSDIIRETGILKVYDSIKGYRFITRAVGKDVYLHFSEFLSDNDAAALMGSTIEFEVLDAPGSKGPRAKKAIIIS